MECALSHWVFCAAPICARVPDNSGPSTRTRPRPHHVHERADAAAVLPGVTGPHGTGCATRLYIRCRDCNVSFSPARRQVPVHTHLCSRPILNSTARVATKTALLWGMLAHCAAAQMRCWRQTGYTLYLCKSRPCHHERCCWNHWRHGCLEPPEQRLGAARGLDFHRISLQLLRSSRFAS